MLERTIERFKSQPRFPNVHPVAQAKYSAFCQNRTAELYNTFFTLVGIPDISEAKYVSAFNACVPFPGKAHERKVAGMAKNNVAHGVIRYKYQTHVIEECRIDGKNHGLRVVCTEMGHIWLRLYANGNRLAQLVLSSDFAELSSPSPVDEGGLNKLRSHLHLIRKCFTG